MTDQEIKDLYNSIAIKIFPTAVNSDTGLYDMSKSFTLQDLKRFIQLVQSGEIQ